MGMRQIVIMVPEEFFKGIEAEMLSKAKEAREVIIEAPKTETPQMDMSISALTAKREFAVRGKTFQVICNPEQWHPSWWSHCDEVETREAWWDIKEGDVVLDIGADYGSYTLPALAMGAAKVIAWSPPFKDPAPVEAYTIKMSAWENGFEDRLVVMDDGLWSARGWLASMDGPRPPRLFPTRDEAKAAIAGQPGYCTAFPVRTVDEIGIIKELSRVDWMKLDTEGCEVEILTGAIETIKKHRPKIMTENHYHIAADIEARTDALILGLGLGYIKVGTRPHHSISHSLYVVE
jgi:FkbM family methyltransferase